MIKYSELLLLDLIGIKSKKNIGNIVNVAFSKNFKKITGLIVKNDKLYKNKVLIPMASIVDIDEDSIIVENDDNLKNEKPYEGKEFNLTDWEVMTEKCECIGYVKDLIIKIDDGEILGFIVSEGLIEDILKGRNFIPRLEIKDIKEKSIVIREEKVRDIDRSDHSYKKIIELED